MVQTGPRMLELQEFPLPKVQDDDAIVRVEACGICGTDLETFRGDIPLRYPVIPGHEAVGIIEEIGELASKAWGVVPGDRVIVPAELSCGTCRACADGLTCLSSPGTHGFLPTTVEPALWGGYSDYLYLSPHSRPMKMSAAVDVSLAALFNPLGAGFAWAVNAPDLQPGQSIAILGPGQRGLASVLAAKHRGASQIYITGFGDRDQRKLDLARTFGADLALDAQSTDIVGELLNATDGRGVDIVVDTTPHATQSIHDALRIVRAGGTVVLAGLKGQTINDFPTDDIAMRRLTLKGVRAVDRPSFQQAIDLIENNPQGLSAMQTHRFPLEQADTALETLADGTGIAISLDPTV